MWLEIKLVLKQIRVGEFYRPPGVTREQSTTVIENLQKYDLHVKASHVSHG
jgi:hypothetical protein